MKMDELNKLYTKASLKGRQELFELGKKIFQKKIEPKIPGAAARGYPTVRFTTFRRKTTNALCAYLSVVQMDYKWNYYASGTPFSDFVFEIYGWQVVNLDPNDILKENI